MGWAGAEEGRDCDTDRAADGAIGGQAEVGFRLRRSGPVPGMIGRRGFLTSAIAGGVQLYAAGRKSEEYFPPPDSEGGWRTPGDPARIRKLTGFRVDRLDEAFE